MNKTTQLLSKEHEYILELIERLEEEVDDLEGGGEIKEDFWRGAIDFIRDYADKFHHMKEEYILFKDLEKKEGEMHCNPIEQMLHEHKLGREFVKGMKVGLKEGNKKKIVENAKGYAALLQDHIFKEDNVLYPMAEDVLDKNNLKVMLDKFLSIENKKEDVKKRCLKWLKNWR